MVQDRDRVSRVKRIEHTLHPDGRDDAQLLPDDFLAHMAITGGDHAIQGGQSIAHGTLPRFRHQPQAVGFKETPSYSHTC